jgi:hypothetical protein
MAMFNNQAQYAHQVGATMGFVPPAGGGGMVAPSFGPSYAHRAWGGQDFGVASYNAPGGLGAAMTTGIGGAIPGVAAGMSLAGGFGLMGRMGGYLDPFTGVGRAFAAGAGTSGLFGTVGGIGNAFATGGMRAGLGMVGGGLAAAALPLAGYAALGYGISTVGENIAQGARNIAQVGTAAQQFIGPSYGTVGARPGGGLPRAEIQGIVSALHEIAGQDVMTTMESVKRLMQQASQMGMLTGVTDANTFKQKFTRIVDQVKNVAKIMGTTLEEAAPLLGQMQSIGLWRASDILGTASALQQVPPQARGAMMGAMQAGAMGSWQQGGTLAAGANLARNQFLNLQAAMRSGAMTNEQLMEFTGGVGGSEGLQMMATQMTGTMQRLGRVPVGRALMAGLGEMVEGRFTGRIDPRRLAQFQAGQMSMDEVLSQGYGRTRTREAAASFTFRSDQLGQDLASQGGMELVGQALNQVMQRAGYGRASEEIRGLFLQNILGMNQREAQQWLDLTKRLPQIMENKTRRERDQLRDQFRRIDELQNRSWEGLKRAIAHRWEEGVKRPLQELAEGLSTAMNERFDAVTDLIYGRQYGFQTSTTGRLREIISGRGGRGAAGYGQALQGGGFRGFLEGGTFIERLRTGRTRAETLVAQGAPTQAFTLRPGESLPPGFFEISSRMEISGFERGPMGTEANYSGNRLVQAARVTDLELAQRHAIARAQGQTFKGMGIHLDDKKRQTVENLKTAYKNLVAGGGPATARLLALRKKYSPGDPNYNRELADLFASMPGVQKDINEMLGGAGRLGNMQRQDAISAIAAEVGTQFELGADRTAFAKGLEEYTAFQSEAEESDFIKQQAQDLHAALYPSKPMAIGAAAGVEAIAGLFREAGGEQISKTRLRDIMRSEEAGGAMRRWIAAVSEGKNVDEIAESAATLEKVAGGRELMNQLIELRQRDPEAWKRVVEGGAKTFAGRRETTLSAKEIEAQKRMAQQEMGLTSMVTGISDQTRREYQGILERAAAGKDVSESVRALSQRLDIGKGGDRELAALEAAGGAYGQFIGRAGRIERVMRAAGGTREDVQQRLEQTGLPIDLILQKKEFRDKYEKMFEMGGRGDAKATKEELEEIVSSLRSISDQLGAKETKAGVQDEKQKLDTAYMEANRQFVTAVGIALGKDVQDAARKIEDMNMDKKGSNPLMSMPE